MAKPKKRFFVIGNYDEVIAQGNVMTREQAEAKAASRAADGEEYQFVAELLETHYQTVDTEVTPYEDGDADTFEDDNID